MPPLTAARTGIRFHPECRAAWKRPPAADSTDWPPTIGNTGSRPPTASICVTSCCPIIICAAIRPWPVTAVTLDIPDHGPLPSASHQPLRGMARRTNNAPQGGKGAIRPAPFPTTELVPGGYITSACSPVVYTADGFPEEYQGNVFVCDPANNLIHRDRLEPNGAVFTAAEPTTMNFWPRRITGFVRLLDARAGGTFYVARFLSRGDETPLSLPDDIKKRLNLESRGHGRIWRISRQGHRPGPTPNSGQPFHNRPGCGHRTAQSLVAVYSSALAGGEPEEGFRTGTGETLRASFVASSKGSLALDSARARFPAHRSR